MINIIVVEDDPDLCGSIVRYLTLVGMNVKRAGSGVELDTLLATMTPDLLVLDVNLPGEDGFSIAARLRSSSKMGIVMLTARSQLDDRVLGLTAGADAYLVKPVQFRELEAVIHSLTRRLRDAQQEDKTEPREEGHHVWSFDSATWSLITPNGHSVSLTNAEYRVLQTLTTDPGASVTREEIAASLGKTVGGYDDRSIDAVMARLRRKVNAAAGENLPIRAVRSVGYVFAAQVEFRARADA
ncbi:DNA-binding response regulator [Paramagnetospirillum kuznetsovii]|uniref:DNA-binding response regulator n=1 Tax=Paramagnetospirillum kuznetsovii TaxID=2053833 RepID=A0A364NU41_9PROT|nr:response regulator transcription factor [Paramagnetospirillum kuznetsovii]RAU20609.1 DNA-binding response regulator [Paramagnetospirillum kuznetsovii]